MTPSFYNEEKNDFKAILEDFARELEEKSAGRTRELDEQAVELEGVRKAITNLLEDFEDDREKLIEANAKDEAVLGSIGDGLVVTDKEGKITLVNAAFEKMFGWKISEIKGKTVLGIMQLADPFDEKVSGSEDLTAKVLNERIAVSVKARFKRKDGALIPVSVNGAPIVIGSEIIGTVAVIHDITEEQELDRVKSEFISVASHQLRTPLTGIQWVIERFTKKEQLTPKGKEYLDDIHMSAKHLTELVDLLLNLSRIESGRVEVIPEPLEMVQFMKGYLEECKPLFDKKNLRMVFEDHPDHLAIQMDKPALRNIIQSLISNAIEYTAAGGEITLAIEQKDATFTIKVQDTGIGIPQNEQSQIFGKFVRATNAKLYKTDGTGIGLYIAERATNRLGGKIWFESEENKGSTFYVQLPVEIKRDDKDHKSDPSA